MEATTDGSTSIMGSMRRLTAFELADLPDEFNHRPLLFTFQREAAKPYVSRLMRVSDRRVNWNAEALPNYPMFDSFTSIIHIRIYEPRGPLQKGKLIARVDESIKASVDYKVFTQRRPIFGKGKGYATLKMETQDVGDGIAIDSAQDRGVNVGHPSRVEGLQQIAQSGTQLVHKVSDAADDASELGIDVGSELSSVLHGLLGVWEKLQDLSEIHPYLNVAYKAVNFAYSQYKDQLARDDKIRQLSVTMSTVYDFLEHADQLDDTEHLKENEARKAILREIIGQTRECMYFIIDYTQQQNFWLRLLGSSKGDADERIDEFNATFTDLQDQFMESAELQGAIIAAELKDDIRKLPFSYHWNFEWVRDAGYDKSKRCLRGTSRATLQKIQDWINGNGESKLFLLTGEPGTGKSAIAHTVAGKCDDDGKLGASFFFNRNFRHRSDPKKVFPTLGYYLTEHNSEIRSALMEKNSSLNNTMSLSEQFDTFLLGPCKGYDGGRTVVIILDAIDESGTMEERHDLLNILALRTNELPSNFRVLVSARSDPDINQTFEGLSSISTMHLRPDKTLKEDIRKYFRFELLEERRYPGINRRSCDALAERSEGLWQWASSACLYIATDPQDPKGNALHRFHSLMDHTAESGMGGRFYVLYRFILDEVNPDLEDFKEVMNFLFSLAEPLSLSSMKTLLSISGLSETQHPPIDDILPYLGSLFSGVRPGSDGSDVVEPLHASVREFFEQHSVRLEDSTEDRINRFYVILQLSVPHGLLAHACVRVLNEQLGFNMAKLATSYRRNRDISDLENRVKDELTRELSYACRFWAFHLIQSGAEETSMILTGLEVLFYDNILFWIEALTLLGAINLAAPALSAAYSWTASHHTSLARFIYDTRTFVRRFAGIMQESTPAIYLSALMNAPAESLLYKQYSPRFPGTARLLTGQSMKWPSQELTLNTVFCHTVAFSPDDRFIVAGLGSNGQNVCVYDAETGETVLPPFDGHESFVNGVDISLDGRLIASGSHDKTVRLWDATSGKPVYGSLNGHRRSVTSVSFSPDGKGVVSGSEDCTLIMWDVTNGKINGAPLKGHSGHVQCVLWLFNGTTIASGGKEGTILLWDVSKKKKSKTLLGHTAQVNAICASRKEPRLLSASNDGTIRIWDTNTGVSVGDPIQPQSGKVTALDISRDDTVIVSGFEDTTLQVWNARTREPISGRIRGHTSSPGCARLSSDGSRIVSAADFDKVRTFDVYGSDAESVPDPLEGMMSIDYTPETQRLVTGHRDGTLKTWSLKDSPALVAEKNAGDTALQHICLTPNGKFAASTAFNDNRVRIWDAENAKPLGKSIPDQGFSVESLQFSQDSKRLAVGSWAGYFFVWDVEKRAFSVNPVKAPSRVQTLAFSYDGEWLITAHWACNIRIWNSHTGKKVLDTLKLKEPNSSIRKQREAGSGDRNPIDCIACSREYEFIVTGSWDYMVRRWDPRTGDVIGVPLAGHTSLVNAVDISPDSAHIVSGSADQTIRIWHAKTGEQLRLFDSPHANTVFYLRYGLSSDQLVSGAYSETIRIWDLSDLSLDQSPFSPDPAKKPAPRYAIGPFAKADASFTSRKGWIIPESQVTPAGEIDEEGSALSAEQDLLFWLPESHLRRLWYPGTRHVVAEGAVMMDLSNFAHGDRWQECISPSFMVKGDRARSSMPDVVKNDTSGGMTEGGEEHGIAGTAMEEAKPKIAAKAETGQANKEDGSTKDADRHEENGNVSGDSNDNGNNHANDNKQEKGPDGNGDSNGANPGEDRGDNDDWVDEDGDDDGPSITDDDLSEGS